MLVEADNAVGAFQQVASKLDEGEPRWSDWHEAVNDPSIMNFAGRWSGEVFMTPEQLKARDEKQEVDVSENPNYLRFSDDPNLADEVIQRFISYRMNEIESIKKTLATDYASIDLMSYLYDPNKEPDFRTTGMGLYYIKKLVSLYGNDWTSDTAIYDLEDWNASLTTFYKRVQNNPERQFLIPVDFHH
jgi:hypothetical protein